MRCSDASIDSETCVRMRCSDASIDSETCVRMRCSDASIDSETCARMRCSDASDRRLQIVPGRQGRQNLLDPIDATFDFLHSLFHLPGAHRPSPLHDGAAHRGTVTCARPS